MRYLILLSLVSSVALGQGAASGGSTVDTTIPGPLGDPLIRNQFRGGSATSGPGFIAYTNDAGSWGPPSRGQSPEICLDGPPILPDGGQGCTQSISYDPVNQWLWIGGRMPGSTNLAGITIGPASGASIDENIPVGTDSYMTVGASHTMRMEMHGSDGVLDQPANALIAVYGSQADGGYGSLHLQPTLFSDGGASGGIIMDGQVTLTSTQGPTLTSMAAAGQVAFLMGFNSTLCGSSSTPTQTCDATLLWDTSAWNFNRQISVSGNINLISGGSFQSFVSSGSQYKCVGGGSSCDFQSGAGQGVTLDSAGAGTAIASIGATNATSTIVGRTGQSLNLAGAGNHDFTFHAYDNFTAAAVSGTVAQMGALAKAAVLVDCNYVVGTASIGTSETIELCNGTGITGGNCTGTKYATLTIASTDAQGAVKACTINTSAVAAGALPTWIITVAAGTTDGAGNLTAHFTE